MWQYKGYDLPRDLPLIFCAFAWLVYYEIMIHFRPLPKILAQIREMPATVSCTPPQSEVMSVLDKLWRACGYWMARFLRNPRPCLRRSLVLYSWCTKHSVKSKVVIGVDKENDILKGHAWLYVQGEVFRENAAELAKNYTVMLEG